MPLEDPHVIDIITSKDGRLQLVITDAGVTTDPRMRLALYRAKLDAYAMYVDSPEFAAAHPNFARADVSIEIICATPPPPEMVALTGVNPPGSLEPPIPVSAQQWVPEERASPPAAPPATATRDALKRPWFRRRR
jgi:hypothetical protein